LKDSCIPVSKQCCVTAETAQSLREFTPVAMTVAPLMLILLTCRSPSAAADGCGIFAARCREVPPLIG
jgi:hypothetical protein